MPKMLQQLVQEFARAIVVIDARKPIATSLRTAMAYQAGIGPHSEAKTIELVIAELKSMPAFAATRLGVPYPASPRQRCDLVVSNDNADWHLEFKLLRLMGDNGKTNDNMLMHILSPYAQHRSAVTDCTKLLKSGFPGRLGVVIFGYEYPEWPMMVAIEAFERLASNYAKLSPRVAAEFSGLIHPIHRSGLVAAWEVIRAT